MGFKKKVNNKKDLKKYAVHLYISPFTLITLNNSTESVTNSSKKPLKT